jgi:hypothetical protein
MRCNRPAPSRFVASAPPASTTPRAGQSVSSPPRGGNAGIAVAYAGRRLGIPVTVVVPETTTATALRLIAQEGAEVVVHGASWQEADTFARGLQDATCAFIHPFDDPLLVGGPRDPDRRGGRLWGHLRRTGGERRRRGPIGGDGGGLGAARARPNSAGGGGDGGRRLAGAQSLARGARVELPAITSIATSLGAKRVAARAFELCQERPVRSQVVDDRAALAGLRLALGAPPGARRTRLRRRTRGRTHARWPLRRLPRAAGDRLRRRDEQRGATAGAGGGARLASRVRVGALRALDWCHVAPSK